MDNSRQPTAVPDNEAVITLGLLNAVEENSEVTQRSMAGELGIALGLANAYLKRCVKKGLIKVSQAPANRYAYYLTPQGFAEKSRLTAEYLSISFNFFRAARSQCSDVFEECADHDWRRVLLAGASDLTEIATLCAGARDIELIGLLDLSSGAPTMEIKIENLTRVSSLEKAPIYDAIVITDMRQPQWWFDQLVKSVPRERVLAPRLLNVSRVRPKLAP